MQNSHGECISPAGKKYWDQAAGFVQFPCYVYVGLLGGGNMRATNMTQLEVVLVLPWCNSGKAFTLPPPSHSS